jgi:hypothetical protein
MHIQIIKDLFWTFFPMKTNNCNDNYCCDEKRADSFFIINKNNNDQ